MLCSCSVTTAVLPPVFNIYTSLCCVAPSGPGLLSCFHRVFCYALTKRLNFFPIKDCLYACWALYNLPFINFSSYLTCNFYDVRIVCWSVIHIYTVVHTQRTCYVFAFRQNVIQSPILAITHDLVLYFPRHVNRDLGFRKHNSKPQMVPQNA